MNYVFFVPLQPIMIVANMNLHEVYANLMADKSKLDWKRDALFPKAAKELLRQGEFPVWVTCDYKLPSSNNQYIIYFYAEQSQGPILGDYLCVMFDGSKRFVIKWTKTTVPEIHVLTSHFLQRYKERFLMNPDMNADEVAVRYFTRNRDLRPIAVDERVSKRIAEYGEYAGEGFLVRDGFCFKLSGEEKMEGETPIRISFFTTFMPLSEMSDTQRDAIYEECVKGASMVVF